MMVVCKSSAHMRSQKYPVCDRMHRGGGLPRRVVTVVRNVDTIVTNIQTDIER
jgi:hypothetical protein